MTPHGKDAMEHLIRLRLTEATTEQLQVALTEAEQYAWKTRAEAIRAVLEARVERDEARRMLAEHNAALRTVTSERDAFFQDALNLNAKALALEAEIGCWREAQAEWVSAAVRHERAEMSAEMSTPNISSQEQRAE